MRQWSVDLPQRLLLLCRKHPLTLGSPPPLAKMDVEVQLFFCRIFVPHSTRQRLPQRTFYWQRCGENTLKKANTFFGGISGGARETFLLEL